MYLLGEPLLLRDYTELPFLMVKDVKHFAICTIDTQGIITSWNKASEVLFGYNAEIAIGKPLSQLFPEMVENGHLQEDIERALEKGQFEHVAEAKRKGRKITIRCIVTALWGKDHELKGFSKIIQDVTDELELADKQKQFISLAGHELKNPIASIKAYLQLIQLRLAKHEDASVLPFVDKALLQVDRLTKLVQDVLDTSQLCVGKLTFHDRDTVYLDELLIELIDKMKVIFPDAIIRFIKKPHVYLNNVDKNRFSQVVGNLLHHALLYSPNHQPISISLLQRKNYIDISIQDEGLGIEKNDLKHIFDLYYRGSTTKNGEKGLGLLGLHVAQAIVHHYHGKISVKSHKRKGSIFSVSIPVA